MNFINYHSLLKQAELKLDINIERVRSPAYIYNKFLAVSLYITDYIRSLCGSLCYLFTRYQKKIKGASFTSSKNQPLYERFLEYDVDAEVKYLE